MKINVQQLSKQYKVRDLVPDDALMVYEMLRYNTIFYQYHPSVVTVESVLADMKALPPSKSGEDKHFIGFFNLSSLVAVMDLIEDYPSPHTAWIGFFSVNSHLQGSGIGTAILSDCLCLLKQSGFQKVRLGVDKGNPQSSAFWIKNHFEWTGEECFNDFSSYLLMERTLGYSDIISF